MMRKQDSTGVLEQKMRKCCIHRVEHKKDFKVIYTNVDRFLSDKLEINYYLRKNEPDVLCLMETKLMLFNY